MQNFFQLFFNLPVDTVKQMFKWRKYSTN